MGLSEDSRTLLQLLLGRGKSYADIAGLLGVDEAEVRRRAHDALTEMCGEDPDRKVNLTDYLLGQSDPIGRADVARELADDPATAETAAGISDQLRLLIPGADLPRLDGSGRSAFPSAGVKGSSGPSTRSRATASAPDGQAAGEPKRWTSALSQHRLLAVLLLSGLLVVIVAVLLVVNGGDDAASKAEAGNGGFAGASMQPVGGQEGSGRIELGRVDQNFAASMRFNGLAQTGKTDGYVLWMDGSLGAFPLTSFDVGKDGSYSNTVVLPPAALCSMAAGIFTDLTVSRISKAQSQAVVARTQKALQGNQKKLPALTGKKVYDGPVALPAELRSEINQQCQTPAGQSQKSPQSQ